MIRDILRGRLVVDPDPHGLRLRGARISGQLDLENLNTNVSLELNDCFLAADSSGRLAVDGLTYSGVPELVSAPGWLRLLRHGTPGYAAQPYQQLAAGCRALGYERRGREVLMAQRDDELALADTCWQERLRGKITK